MGRRLLVLPHVGTALGHLIRVADLLHLIGDEWDEIFVSIPAGIGPHAVRFLPPQAKILEYRTRFTVTGPSGKVDKRLFLTSVQANESIVSQTSPDFILGDPGIIAGLVGEKFGIPWGHITHAPYLPFPKRLLESEHYDLANKAWRVLGAALDGLVSIGSNGHISDWSSLSSRAQETFTISHNGKFFRNNAQICEGNGKTRKGWNTGEPMPCIVTVSSGDSNAIPRALTDYLAAMYESVGVIGPCSPYPNKKVKYLGTGYDLSSLVSSDTFVVTHGGSGTLQRIYEAKTIAVVPGDLDQLCNGLLAHAMGRVSIKGLSSWNARIASGAPFVRDVPWDEFLNDPSPNANEDKS